jgi:hypothetical protein
MKKILAFARGKIVTLGETHGHGGVFFVPCPSTGGLSVPRKSGQVRNADLTIMQHGGRCPDLSGPAGAVRIGHGKKRHLHAHSPVNFKELRCYELVLFYQERINGCKGIIYGKTLVEILS